MIPDYNQIDIKNDSIEVINEKIRVIKEMYADGDITLEELEAEKAKTARLNYAFNW